jgi:electron transport complex protein RnfG
MPSEARRHERRGRGRLRVACAAILVWGAVVKPLPAQPISREEALAAVYPGAQFRTEQIFLKPEEQQQAARLAGVAVPSALVVRYVAVKDQAVVGRAYIDTHLVRTKKETLLISLDAAGRVKRIDILAFLEPPEYRPSEPWRRQFSGRTLDEQTALHRAIRTIAGATLTARAVTEATRRVLALDRVLAAREEPRP